MLLGQSLEERIGNVKDVIPTVADGWELERDHAQPEKEVPWRSSQSSASRSAPPAASTTAAVEFQHDPAVIDAWKHLLESFETPGQENRRSTALTRLLSEVAKSLGAPIEQLDVFSGAYSPQGWFDADEQNADIRAYLHDIATGKKALPMISFSPPEGQALPEP